MTPHRNLDRLPARDDARLVRDVLASYHRGVCPFCRCARLVHNESGLCEHCLHAARVRAGVLAEPSVEATERAS